MPPVNAPRPDQATYESVATFLETELDRAAAAKPNPGRMPLLHRLSRTEYQNAVRDLLALDALPQEMDYSTLLPAGQHHQRLRQHRGSALRLADDDGALSGRRAKNQPHRGGRSRGCRRWSTSTGCLRSTGRTRGSTSCRSERAAASRSAALPRGRRLRRQARSGGRGPRGARARDHRRRRAAADDHGRRRRRRGAWRRRRAAPAPPLEFRIPVKAGVRLVGITFIEQNQARNEETLRPRMRARGTKPALVSAVISGPYNVAGPGDSPSRRRIFVCRPEPGGGAAATDQSRARSGSCRRWCGGRTGGRGPMPRSSVCCRSTPRAGPKADSIAGFKRRSNGCWSARSSCSASSGIRRMSRRDGLSRQRSGAGVAPVVFPLEQHSRRRAAGCGRRREVEAAGACSNGRSGGCSPIRVPNRW